MHVHVVPTADLVDHDTTGDDCVCGPTVEPVTRYDGSIGWLLIHHSLDGRESHERPHEPTRSLMDRTHGPQATRPASRADRPA